MRDFLVVVIRLASALLALIVLIAALRGDLRHHYRKHFSSERRERLFLASLSFLTTMFALRALTWAIHNHIGPMHDIETKSFISITWFGASWDYFVSVISG